MRITVFIACILAFFATVFFAGCNQAADTIIVHPKEINDFLLNPGRGFTSTGSRFNSSIDSQQHPLTGVYQQRYYWDVLEPEEGKVNFELLDRDLQKAVANGQLFNPRVMCQNEDMVLPAWVIKAGVKSPYYDHPVFVEKQINLVKKIAQRYDGNPGICFVDIGSIGQWGEWHIDPLAKDPGKILFPTQANAQKIIDAYVDNFKKTPLVALMSFEQPFGTGYAVAKGAGWRADCWGDMDSLGWNHMKGVYPQAIAASHADSAWKKAPVALETCWTMEEWFKRGWDLDYILTRALDWHVSSVNNGTEAIPVEWRQKVNEFEKKLGYRFAIKEISYPAEWQQGRPFAINMQWENKGVAPVYLPYEVAFRLVSVSDTVQKNIIRSGIDARKWQPGSSAVNFTDTLGGNNFKGTCKLQIGLLQPGNHQPAIQLAIEGRTSDGWYDVGKINIVN